VVQDVFYKVDYYTMPSILENIESLQSTTSDHTCTQIMSMEELLLADGLNLYMPLFGPRFKLRQGGLLAISLSNQPLRHLHP